LVVPAAIIDACLPHRTPAETFQLTRFERAEANLDGERSFLLELGSMRACW
jgi:hypothetical protein